MRNASGAPQGGVRFNTLPIGAGGFLTAGGQIADDGTIVSASDAYGAFVLAPGADRFQSLFRPGVIPSADLDPATAPSNYPTYVDESQGGWGITVAPSDGTRIYFSYNGMVYRSDDRGQTSTRIGGPYVMKAAGGGYYVSRDPQRRMITDPINPDVMMFAPQEAKLVYTLDGGDTALVEIAIAAGTTDGTNAAHGYVAVDPSGTVPAVGGVSQKWAYSKPGDGIRISTTGPAGPYTASSGAPSTPRALIFGPDGTLWAIQRGSSMGLWKLPVGGSWTNVSAPSLEWKTIAIDPSNANSIVLAGENGDLARSIDGGASWVGADSWHSNWPGPYGITLVPTAIGWMGDGPQRGNRFFPSELTFHPTNGKLYAFNGIGMHWSVPPTTFSEWFWFDQSLGVENMETGHVLMAPGQAPLVSVHDQGVFRITDEQRWRNGRKYPAVNGTGSFGHGWFADYLWSDPTQIVSTCAYTSSCAGKSSDGGENWAPLGAHPSGSNAPGGSTVMLTATDWLWFPSNNFRPAITHDAGATWAYEDVPGIPTTGETGWGYSMWGPHWIVTADQTTGNAYAYNYGPSSNASLAGIYKRTFSTGTWTKVFNGNPGGVFASALGHLMVLPENPSHIYWKGDNGGLYRSTNGAVTWTLVPGVTHANAYAFGKAASEGGYPTLYVMGTVNGVSGLHRSFDEGATWKHLGDYPDGNIGAVHTIAASRDEFGKVIVGFDHSGAAIGYYDDAVTLT